MPLNPELYSKLATRGEVAEASLNARGVALALKIYLDAQGTERTGAIKDAYDLNLEALENLKKQFNELVGWTDE
jgi:hypothetical protein